MTDAEIIELLGGVTAIARMLGIKPPSVSGWLDTGIPEGRLRDLAGQIEIKSGGRFSRKARWPDMYSFYWPELAEAKTAQAQDAISDVAAEAQAAILHVAETAEAEIKQAIEELRHGAPAAEPWDGVSERRHVSAPCTASGQETAGPPEPVDPALSRAIAEAAQAGLIERRRVLRRAQDKARAGLAYRAAGEEV